MVMGRLFGTNGIRGVVNEDMHVDLALGIGKAWGTYFKKQIDEPKIAVGTDIRLSNHMLKNAITAGLLATGCDVVDGGLMPTPALQYWVKEKGFDSGVIITASHNPPEFNGIKGVSSDGREFTSDIEEEIERIYFEKDFKLSNWKEVGRFSTWDEAIDHYINGILSKVDVDCIKKEKFHVVLDCGNGAGSVVTPMLLKKLGCKVTELYCTPDGTFPGRNSEPVPENLSDLMKKVPEVNADFGVAQDGDADRAIFIDKNGGFIWGDKILALGAKYATQQQSGRITVTPVTTSSCFDDVVKENKGAVIHTRVGSPTVAKVMKEKNAVFGGEGNGGLIFPEMQYCRDSAMSIAKILELLACEQKSLDVLVDEIPDYALYKTKTPCPNEKKRSVMRCFAAQAKDSPDVVDVDETDGVKLFVEDGWVLVRPSGTEPIFRVYAESAKESKAEELASLYKQMVREIIEES